MLFSGDTVCGAMVSDYSDAGSMSQVNERSDPCLPDAGQIRARKQRDQCDVIIGAIDVLWSGV